MLMRPTVDIAFKKIFANEKKPEILIGFLNAILECPDDDRITKIRIMNPNNDKEFKEESFSVLDVKAETNRHEIINIEIQVAVDKSMINRSLYYGARMMTLQPKPPKENYNILKNIISINILAKNLKDLKDEPYHSRHAMTSLDTGNTTTKAWMIHFFELEKMNSSEEMSEKDIWLQFLKQPELFISDEGKAKGNPFLDSAVKELQRLSLEPEEIEQYLAREKQIMDQESLLASALEEGEEKGVRKEKINAIQRAIRKGYTKELVMSICDCSEELYQSVLASL